MMGNGIQQSIVGMHPEEGQVIITVSLPPAGLTQPNQSAAIGNLLKSDSKSASWNAWGVRLIRNIQKLFYRNCARAIGLGMRYGRNVCIKFFNKLRYHNQPKDHCSIYGGTACTVHQLKDRKLDFFFKNKKKKDCLHRRPLLSSTLL